MLRDSGSRLAVAAVLLMLQSIIFILELLVFARRVRRQSWYRPLRQLIGPVSITLLATILISIVFTDASENVDSAAQQCNTSVDGDIAGQGAQIAVWAQVGVLVIISVLGSFHTSATGAKEVGAGLTLTHVSLSIALLAQMARGTLSPADAVVGAMILDAQNIGMSIQLASKETLASRWQVGVVVISQTFGLAVMPLLVSKFSRTNFSIDDCRCLTVFWWAWLSSCGQGTTAAWEMSVFWTYYACRCVGFCQTSFHSLYNTSKFDKAEKSERSEEDDYPADQVEDEERKLSENPLHKTQQSSGTGNDNQPDLPQSSGNENTTDSGKVNSRGIRLRRVTHLYRRSNGQVVFFREYPATVTLMYMVYGVLSLASMGTAQATVTNFNLKPPSPIDSVGQIISLIVAAATVCRAAWLFLMLFRRDRRQIREGKSRYVWPFRWDVVRNTLLANIAGDYVLCFLHKHEPTFLALGDILTEPFDASSRVGGVCSTPEAVCREQLDEDTYSQSNLVSAPGFESSKGQELCAEGLDTTWFDPKAPSLDSYIARRRQALLDTYPTTKPQTVYMVTGKKVAQRVTVSNKASHRRHVGVIGVQAAAERRSSKTFEHDQEVLFGYRLHVFRWSRGQGDFVEDGTYRAAEDW